jgi:hypothetical protein
MVDALADPPIDDRIAPTMATVPNRTASRIRSSRNGPPFAISYP